MKHFKYLQYLLRHKWYVAQACFRRGLYWQGIVHDWSKFRPSEWIPYANFFYGASSKEDVARAERILGYRVGKTRDELRPAFDAAWLAHQHANPHHWQHWVLRNDNGTTIALEMPWKFAVEMVCDWDGAGMAINGKNDTRNWYLTNREKMLLHPRTQAFVEELLWITK